MGCRPVETVKTDAAGRFRISGEEQVWLLIAIISILLMALSREVTLKFLVASFWRTLKTARYKLPEPGPNRSRWVNQMIIMRSRADNNVRRFDDIEALQV